MAKSNTRKYIIWGSAAVLIGAVGYMLWKKFRKAAEAPKNDEVITDQTQTQTQTESNSTNNTPSGPTTAQIELNNKYRTWANSTPELAKKWGKTSKYDLDATGSYNKFFLDSYNGGGKAEYEAFLKGGNTPGEILLKSNVAKVDRMQNSWKGTVSYVQLGGAPTGIMNKKFEKGFAGKNSKGDQRTYKITLYAQSSATNKKPVFKIEEYYYDYNKSNRRGAYIGDWEGYWDLSSDGSKLSYEVFAGGTKGNKGTANGVANFVKGTTYATWLAWI